MSNAQPSGIEPEFTFGDRLRKAREVAAMTLEDMAQIIGVTERTIRNYESARTPVKRSTVIAWALATGVSFEWIWGGDPEARRCRCTVPSLVAA